MEKPSKARNRRKYAEELGSCERALTSVAGCGYVIPGVSAEVPHRSPDKTCKRGMDSTH